MSNSFEVVFEGKLMAGAQEQQVKQNIARMFKADDAKLATLFSGRKIVIKAGLDKTTAQKYLQAMKKAGAAAQIRDAARAAEPVQEKAPVAKNPASFASKDFERPSMTSVAQARVARKEEAAAALEAESSKAVSDGIPVPQVDEVSEDEMQQAMAKLQQEQAKAEEPEKTAAPVVQAKTVSQDLTIAPVGSQLLPDKKDTTPDAPNTDHLDITAMEGYLVEPEPEKPAKVPDISHLHIQEP